VSRAGGEQPGKLAKPASQQYQADDSEK